MKNLTKKLTNAFLFVLIINANAQTINQSCTGVSLSAVLGYQDNNIDYTPPLGYSKSMSSATGSYVIWPAAGNSCNSIRKPIIIVEGYDPKNSYAPVDYYYLIDNWSLIRNLRGQGYDVIILNFNNGADYIQRNAYLLMELINQVNSLKQTSSELVVVGVSMGGLVARYCLTYMESQNMNHQVRLFLSYDSPQNGANIPLGMQGVLQDFANNAYTLTSVFPNYSDLKSPAAVQMLKYHINKSLSGSRPSTICCESSWHTTFMNELRGLNYCNGYPKNCRNIAVTLGSINGTLQLAASGATAVSGGTALDFQIGGDQFPIAAYSIQTVPTSPPIPSGSNGYLYYGAILLTGNSSIEVQPFSQGIDIVPGGYSEVFKLVSEGLKAAFSTSSYKSNNPMERATFIPTISALDYKETNQSYNIQSDVNSNTHLSKTPFNNIYTGNGSINYRHDGFIPSGISNWIYKQITGSFPNVASELNKTLNNQTINSNQRITEKAVNSINATNYSIESGANVTLKAGGSIRLGAGFRAKTGSTFRPQIESTESPKVCTYNRNAREGIDEDLNETNLTQNKFTDKMAIYPNPTSKSIIFKTNRIEAENITIKIVDLHGKILKQLTLSNIKSETEAVHEIDLSELTEGAYMVEVTTDEQITSEKVVVKK